MYKYQYKNMEIRIEAVDQLGLLASWAVYVDDYPLLHIEQDDTSVLALSACLSGYDSNNTYMFPSEVKLNEKTGELCCVPLLSGASGQRIRFSDSTPLRFLSVPIALIKPYIDALVEYRDALTPNAFHEEVLKQFQP